MKQKHYISTYTNKCFNEGYTVRAKICTKIEAKTEAEAGCRD